MTAAAYTETIIGSFHPLVVPPKNKCKVKKNSQKVCQVCYSIYEKISLNKTSRLEDSN